MFVFLLILLINIIFALPLAKKSSITNVYIEGTTTVPHDIIHRILMSNVKESSNPLHKSINALQSMIKSLFQKKSQHEKNFPINRHSLLIGCLINRAKHTEAQRRACKGFYEKKDKSVNESDHSLIDVEHINVARGENDTEKQINDTIEEIQKLITIGNRLINNETDEKEMNFGLRPDFPFSQNLTNQMNVGGSKTDNIEEMLQSLANNYTTDKTADNSSNIEAFKQVPPFISTDSTEEQKDFSSNIGENLSSLFPEKNIIEENNGDKLNINTDNDTDIQSLTNNKNEKLEHRNKLRNKSTVDIWNIGRLSNDPIRKNILLTDLTKALKTLETIVNGKGFGFDDDQITFKPADLHSIIKFQKFSWKLFQFLNRIKKTIEQLNTNNKKNSIN